MSKKKGKSQDLSKKVIQDPVSSNKYSTFSVYKTNDKKKEYYITTVCKRDLEKKELELKNQYPNLKEVKVWNDIPNAKHVMDNVKKNVKGDVESWRYNNFTVKDNVSEKKIISAIDKIQKDNIAEFKLSAMFENTLRIK